MEIFRTIAKISLFYCWGILIWATLYINLRFTYLLTYLLIVLYKVVLLIDFLKQIEHEIKYDLFSLLGMSTIQ